jgi:hypothetical protein
MYSTKINTFILLKSDTVRTSSESDINRLFQNKSSSLLPVFDKLLGYVVEFGDMNISTTKNCILFHHNQTFLVVKPMKNSLNIKFYLAQFEEDELIYKTALYGKQFEHHIRVSTLDQVNNVLLKYIKLSYKLFQK